MDREQLHQTLRKLHSELQSTETADPQTRELLTAVQNDIDRVTNPDDDDPDDFGERVESLAARFEADHPSMAMALRQVMTALSGMGI